MHYKHISQTLRYLSRRGLRNAATAPQKEEMVAVSLCFPRTAIHSSKDEARSEAMQAFAWRMLRNVYSESRPPSSFEDWVRITPVLLGDTLYDHNDLVFETKARRRIVQKERGSGGDGSDMVVTQADEDGKILADALKKCGAQNVHRWSEHLKWPLYETLRNLTDEHLDNNSNARECLVKQATDYYCARKGEPLGHACPGKFGKKRVVAI